MTVQVPKIRALGSDVDAVTLRQAIEIVVGWVSNIQAQSAGERAQQACRYVVTPNLDHAVQLKHNVELREAYRHASLVLADGMPLVWASRLFRRPLPERVAGSDLGPGVLSAAPEGTRLFLLGAGEEASRRAAERVRELYPQVHVVGRLSPPFGFEQSQEWSERICSQVAEAQTELLFVGFGAPKQELWVHRHRQLLGGPVALCVGATIDFISGSKPRAPRWAQRAGVEWLHRLMSDPRRLAKRYAIDAIYLPGLLLADAFHRAPAADEPALGGKTKEERS